MEEISNQLKKSLLSFLEEQRSPKLLNAYLSFLEMKFHLSPVVFPKEKMIYKNAESAIEKLEKEGKIWSKTIIKIGIGPPAVNEQTKKIYICPFSGKVFGDNTHLNPQDAIYDWISKCPQNVERMGGGGMRAKRFFISEDPEVIKNYIKPHKEPITKTVFSSKISGALFNSKEAVIQDFKEHYLHPMKLLDVQNQSRFELEPSFLEFIQNHLQEDKIALFVEKLAEDEEFHPYVTKWIEVE